MRDNVGNMTSRSDSSGTRNYTYDDNNRLTKISSGSGTINFSYDGANNRTLMTSPSASISYTYDSVNRLTKKAETISGIPYSTDYIYNGNDYITDIYYPTGLHVSYGYNSNYEVNSVSDFGGSVTSFSYNLAGQPTSFNYSNGKNTSISYNSRFFTTRITSSNAIDIGYTTYDSRGNVKAITNYLDSLQNQSFNYDSLDRLTNFSGAWGSGSYSYSASGNRSSKTVAGVNTSYSYLSNRLDSTSGGEPAIYDYYGNGNLLQIQRSGITYSLSYDGFGNMTSYSSGGAPLADFKYDGDGMRVKKTVSGKTIIYHYDQAGKTISETYDNGSFIADYIYANGKLAAKVISDVIDTDGDLIPDDGDGSGIVGDYPCTNGNTSTCDDNCKNIPNTDQSDIDGDGIGSVCDPCINDPSLGCGPDSDSDGMPDSFEIRYNLNNANDDPDNDGLTNLQEYIKGTNPLNPDTDGDGIGDATDACPLTFPVRIAGAYYSTLQDAYNAASDGDVIKTQAVELPGSLNTSLGKLVTIRGGYDCGYTTNTWETSLKGSQKINSGRIKIDSGRIKIK